MKTINISKFAELDDLASHEKNVTQKYSALGPKLHLNASGAKKSFGAISVLDLLLIPQSSTYIKMMIFH